MNKKTLIFILICIGIIKMIFEIGWMWSIAGEVAPIIFDNSCSGVMERNWEGEIILGKGYEEIYEDVGVPSPQGDGVRYHVFQYENDVNLHSKTRGEIQWEKTTDKQKEFFYELVKEREPYGRYMPDFKKETFYYYYKKEEFAADEIIIIYQPEVRRLYIVESFM